MSEKPKPQRPKRTPRRQKVDVQVEVTKKTTQSRRRRRRRNGYTIPCLPRAQDHVDSTEKTLRRLQRKVDKVCGQASGPRVQSVMKTSTTIGPIYGNPENTLSRSARVFLSPLFLRPKDAQNTPTPLSVRGSQYNLWRPKDLTINLKPMVGNSMVTGSMVYVDIDLDGSTAKPENVDTLKARLHKEVPLGSTLRWKVPMRNLEGPREGWWLTDTNEPPSQSLGPAIGLHVYMQTVNIMGTVETVGQTPGARTTIFTGPLFLVDVTVTYEFTNYDPKPALAKLEKQDTELTTEEADLTLLDDGTLALQVDAKSAFAAVDAWDIPITRAANNSSKSTVAWSVASEVVGVVSQALGPWGWLLKGGWFVIRKIFGAPTRAAGKELYAIYPSVDAAQKDNPVKLDKLTPVGDLLGDSTTVQLPGGYYTRQQLNSPNLNTQYDTFQGGPRVAAAVDINYLPMSYAQPQPQRLTPSYHYDLTGGYQAGIAGMPLPPGIGINPPVDAVFYVTGAGKVSYISGLEPTWSITVQATPSANGIGQLLDFNLGPYNGKRLYFCLVEWENPIFFGNEENRTMGVMHTQQSLVQALQHAQKHGLTMSNPCPAQIFLWVQAVNGNSYLKQWLNDKLVCGKKTAIMTMKLGAGKSAINYDGDAAYVKNMLCDLLLFFNLDTGFVQGLFATDFEPEKLESVYPMIYASNVQDYTNWRTRHGATIYHEEHSFVKKGIHEPVESDVECLTDPEEFPPPLPVKIKKRRE